MRSSAQSWFEAASEQLAVTGSAPPDLRPSLSYPSCFVAVPPFLLTPSIMPSALLICPRATQGARRSPEPGATSGATASLEWLRSHASHVGGSSRRARGSVGGGDGGREDGVGEGDRMEFGERVWHWSRGVEDRVRERGDEDGVGERKREEDGELKGVGGGGELGLCLLGSRSRSSSPGLVVKNRERSKY